MQTTEPSSSSSDGSKVGVAYLGIPGAYSEAAALKAYPKSETVPCEQFQAAFKAFAQCEMTLSKLGIIRVSADDTAGAAKMVASCGERDTGAVASARAAKIYGLDVLAEKTRVAFFPFLDDVSYVHPMIIFCLCLPAKRGTYYL
ncbi:hypothetical protein QYF36_002601 [Acer negundo]|nr:hypothetical protein QYF36_002601 [Acer negundo]